MIRVICISSVQPKPTSAGNIVLHRHLVGNPEIELIVHSLEPVKPRWQTLVRRIGGRLERVRFLSRFIQDFWVLWEGRWIDAELPSPPPSPLTTVVLTVAHGDGGLVAMRYAQLHSLPLVSIFHDWWPDIPNVHQRIRPILERNFHTLNQASHASLCVSAGMMSALGNTPNAHVLLPIPGKDFAKINLPVHKPEKFKIIYSGNLTEYGPQLIQLLESFNGHKMVDIEVRGDASTWPLDIRKTMQERGTLLPFVSRDELAQWIQSADAFLILQNFENTSRRRMETSFPSKLIDFSRMGKPLIIWGPDYCSGVRWGEDSKAAYTITAPDPKAAVVAAEDLASSPIKQLELAERSKLWAENEFSREIIQADFLRYIKRASEEKLPKQPGKIRRRIFKRENGE